jgi:putative FmdB family regulatory protein
VPIYDYRCTACGHRIDILHGVNESGPNFCPECGAEGTMRKAISAPSIHFKGSGWAKKDRTSATKTKAAAKSEAAPKSGDGETKPDGAAGTGPAEPSKPAAPASSDAD